MIPARDFQRSTSVFALAAAAAVTAALLLLVPRPSPGQTGRIERARLDHARRISDQGITFVPFKGLQRGVFWYDQYRHAPTAVSSFREYKRVFVNIKPTAHGDGRYARFLREHPGISDVRVVWNDSSAPCRVTPELEALVADVPYRPAVLGPAYPDLCMVSIIFPASVQGQVMDLIARNRAVSIEARAAMCDPSSPRYSAGTIADQLLTRGTVSATEVAHVWRGDAIDVAAESSLIVEDPGLGVVHSGDPAQVLEHFLRQSVMTPQGETQATVSVDPSLDPVYICEEQVMEASLVVAAP